MKKPSIPDQTMLKINDDAPITLYTHHCLPLLIPISEDFDYWRWCNFINIYYHRDYPTSYDYTDYKRYYSGIFDTTFLKYDDMACLEHSSFWTQQIANGKYIYFWLNQRYIPTAYAYNAYNNTHPILIYGYQNDLLYAKAFDTSEGIYDLEFHLEDFIRAVEITLTEQEENIADEDEIMLIKPKVFSTSFIKNRHFLYLDFCRELSDYYYGNGRIDNWYHFFQETETYDFGHPRVYGLRVTELIIAGFKDETDLPVADYRLIHMVVENKKLIAERLTALAKQHDLTAKLNSFAAEYDSLVSRYISFRMKYMKLSMLENNMQSFYPIPQDPKHLENLTQMLSELFAEEKVLMKKILTIVEENCMMSLFSPSMRKLDNCYVKDGYFYTNVSGMEYLSIVLLNMGIHPPKFLEGSDGSVIQYDRTGQYESIAFYKLSPGIEWVRYRIKEEDLFKIASVYGSRKTNFGRAAITASSVLQNSQVDVLPENVLRYDDVTYWTPDDNDRAPCLIFQLAEEETFDHCAISECEESVQISQFAIDVKTGDGFWHEFANFQKHERRKTFGGMFDKVTGKEFRLRILSPQGSINAEYRIRLSYFNLN